MLKNVQLVQTTSSKTTLPIFSNILIEANKDKLILTTTDLELSIKTQFELEILEEGSICLPFKKFFDIIKELEEKDNCPFCSSQEFVQYDWSKLKSKKRNKSII